MADEVRKFQYSQHCLPNRLLVSDVLKRDDEGCALIDSTITICGWVRSGRTAEKDTLAFLSLSDGTCNGTLQAIIKNEVLSEDQQLKSLTAAGTCIAVEGKVVESPAKGQKIEVMVSKVLYVGNCNAKEYPIAKKGHTLEFLRGQSHLRPRTNLISSVMRIRNTLAYATHQFFQDGGFRYLHSPIITASDCEGAGEMFQVTTLMPKAEEANKYLPTTKDKRVNYAKDFFGRPAYLTVSGQLQAEAYACSMSNVYTFGPTFRAEASHTTRHLAEFWMIEPEVAFCDLQDLMQLAEDYVRFCCRAVLERNLEDLEAIDAYHEFAAKQAAKLAAKQKGNKGQPQQRKAEEPALARLRHVAESDFQRISYTDAIEVLLKAEPGTFENNVEWGIDLASEHERYLAEVVYKRPTIIFDYPKAIKAFYMRGNDDGKTVAAMDVVCPQIGELIGGSQREERFDVLSARIQELGLKEEDFSWYFDLRKYGTCPHAGFGLGFERMVLFATGMENIRDTIPFPRAPNVGKKGAGMI